MTHLVEGHFDLLLLPVDSYCTFHITIRTRGLTRRISHFSSISFRHNIATMAATDKASTVSIAPLLARLADPTTTHYSITATEVASAISHIFADAISPVQTGCLLYALHTTQLDRRPDILAACANSMRYAAAQVDTEALKDVVTRRGRKEGTYYGGLVRQYPCISFHGHTQLTLFPRSAT